MKHPLLLAIIACFSLRAATPSVSITGTVTDNAAAGIENARVYLKHYPALFSLTDASGAFSLPSKNPVRHGIQKRPIAGFSIQGNRILFSTSGEGRRFDVDMFGLNGAMVSSMHLKGLEQGRHAVRLPETAHGFYVARIAVGNAVYMVTMAVGTNGVILSTSSQFFTAAEAVLEKSGSAASIDSLIVVAQGFKNEQKGIAAYDAKNVTVRLSASGAWRPTAYPEIADGMGKILAKDRNFEMGQPDPNIGGDGHTAAEQAVHTVTFTHDFWMDMTEVTQKSYADVMAEAYPDFVKPTWPKKYGVGENYPAYCLSWADAVLFCNARSKKAGLDTVYKYTGIVDKPGAIACEVTGVTSDVTKSGYRLPTEAEWEYACKGGTFTDFNWERNSTGYPKDFLDSIEVNSYEVWRPLSWNKGSSDADYGAHQVGQKIHNYYHLYDMAGNVSEYCNDFTAGPYGYAAVTDPTGPSSGNSRMVRGGHWASNADQLRSAMRSFSAPDSSQYFIGFRTVKPIL